MPEPDREPPRLPRLTMSTQHDIRICEEEVLKEELTSLDTGKTLGPDNISPRLLQKCAS